MNRRNFLGRALAVTGVAALPTLVVSDDQLAVAHALTRPRPNEWIHPCDLVMETSLGPFQWDGVPTQITNQDAHITVRVIGEWKVQAAAEMTILGLSSLVPTNFGPQRVTYGIAMFPTVLRQGATITFNGGDGKQAV